MAKKKAASGKKPPKKKAVAHKAPAKKKAAAAGALAAPALPPNWTELFCRESDYGSLNAALVLLHATYPPETTGRYGNLNIQKLTRMMVPRVNGAGNPAAGARVFLRNDQNEAVFCFLRKKDAGEAYCVTICSRNTSASAFYNELIAIGLYARSTANVKPLEIINKNPLPGDLTDAQDPAISAIFTSAYNAGVLAPPDTITLPSPPWPAGPLMRWKIR